MLRSVNRVRQQLRDTDPVYICLALAIGLVFLLIAFRGYSYYFLNTYSMVPVMLFLGIQLTRKQDPVARRHFGMGLAFTAWFMISQLLQFAADLQPRSAGIFFLVYLLALPFSAAARDAQRQIGLKIAGIAYIGGALIIAAFSGLLLLNVLPGFLQHNIFWDGARLTVLWHPNVCACLFMIATAFCLYFFCGSRKAVSKAIFLVLAAMFFVLITLTNSRTGVLLTCCLLGGFVFFSLWKGSWKRFVLVAIAAVVTIAIAFTISQGLFSLHNDRLIQLAMESAAENPSDPAPNLVVNEQTGEVELKTDAAQRSLLSDLGTFNSRTNIWRAALQSVASNPIVLLRGTDSSINLIASHYLYPVYTHNSYLESLITMGIPGLIFAIVFTLCAVWSIACVLLRKTTTMQHKVIALLMICLLAAGILEAYLFQGSLEFLYTDFVFFLSLGYMLQWRKA